MILACVTFITIRTVHCTVPLPCKSKSMKKILKIKSLELDVYVFVEEFILIIEIMLRWMSTTIQIISGTTSLFPEYNLKK